MLLIVRVVIVEDLLRSITNLKKQVVKPASTNPKPRAYPLLCPTIYFLNKSNSKFLCIGLHCHSGFSPIVQVSGCKNDRVIFDEFEWGQVLAQQGVISSFFWGNENIALFQPIKINAKYITFQTINGKKVIKIQEQGGVEVFLGVESVTELWDLLNVIQYRLQILKALEFHTFYTSLVKGVATLPGDIRSNIENVIAPLKEAKSENACCMLEMLKYGYEILMCDIQMEAIAQTTNFEV